MFDKTFTLKKDDYEATVQRVAGGVEFTVHLLYEGSDYEEISHAWIKGDWLTTLCHLTSPSGNHDYFRRGWNLVSIVDDKTGRDEISLWREMFSPA